MTSTNTMNNQLQTLKGFRDFLPSQKRARDFVIGKVRETFELFGFEPLETPTLEYASLLMGKYGTEADKLVFNFEDRGGRQIGLRYDQTVPTARVLAQYQQELPKYFRRYQIQNNFRAEKPQAGRFREFTQCDIDIFGSESEIADAEILACTYYAFKNIGFTTITLVINDRRILIESLKPFTTDVVDVYALIQSIDKLDKLSKSEVVAEIMSKGLSEANASQAIQAIEASKLSDNLSQILSLVQSLGVPKDSLIFNSQIARGLNYYTGMIFEIQLPIEGLSIGSFGGGGRYDQLINQLGGPQIPAVGVAFGLDRMVEAAQKLGLIPQKHSQSSSVLVTIFSPDQISRSLEIASTMRGAGVRVQVFPDSYAKLGKQLSYAAKNGFDYAIIIGEEEIEKSLISLRNLQDSKQDQISIEEAIKQLTQGRSI